LKFLKIADDDTFTTNVEYTPVKLETIDNVPQYAALYDFNGTKYFTYSELNAITWSGNTATWQGGSGISGAPHQNNDASKLLIIDGETSLTNAFINTPTNINCAWIKTGSKLIINNYNSLTIQNQIQLDGEIRMVGNAQLLQTHTGTSQVSGLGKIYIDQLGTTTTTYRYNYWSSPVVEAGINTFAVGNVMKDGTIPTSENSTPLNIQYTTAYDGSKTTPITIADYWVFTYSNGDSGYDWAQKRSNLSITPPLGFIMKGPGDGTQNYTFVGTPNDGNYNSIISAGKLSLLGNPYPSALDAEQFIEDNVSSILGTLSFWEMEGDAESNNTVYLKDAYNKKFYNLSDGVKTLNLNSGIYQNRFFVTFKKKKTSDKDKNISNNLLIYYDKTTSEIVIHQKGLSIRKATLINLVRSKKNTWKNIKNSDKIKLSIKNISDGIYLVKLNTNKGLITKKVFIVN